MHPLLSCLLQTGALADCVLQVRSPPKDRIVGRLSCDRGEIRPRHQIRKNRSVRNPAMVLVQILSDDKVWAHLLAANLRARGVRSRVGDISWFKSAEMRSKVSGPLILDLGARGTDELDEYKRLIESDEGDWNGVIAVVSSGWLRHVRRHLPSVPVVKRHPDMRQLLPEILEKITDRQAAQI